jgi:hypothetical protein
LEIKTNTVRQRLHKISLRLNYEEEIRKSSITDSILLNNYLSSKKLAETANENLKLSGENVQLAYSRYSEGLISLENYLSVYDDYLAVESQYFTRLSDYMINKATISITQLLMKNEQNTFNTWYCINIYSFWL